MTDLVPGSTGRLRGCCWATLRVVETLAPADSSACGSAEELRVNMNPSCMSVEKNYRVDPRHRIRMEGRSVHPSLLQGSPHRFHLALGALAFGFFPGLGIQYLPFNAANELKSETAEVL